METKKLVWIGFAIGSFIGSYIPNLWGAGMFSFSSLFFSAGFGILGMIIAFKINQ